MSDPWARFAARAARSDCAAYFERSPGHAGARGIAVWFCRGIALPPIRRRSDLSSTRRTVDRHLARGRRRAAIGYLGFEAVGLFEPALRAVRPAGPFPSGEFLLGEDVERRAMDATSVPTSRTREHPVGSPVSDTMSQRRFRASVGRLRRSILEGQAFQVVLAHRRAWVRPDDLLERAGRLRASERFAFFYYLRAGDREIAGASPESVVEVHARHALVNPIAGTMPRSAGLGRPPLRRDAKELAEHRMLVDLARNDLGRVARPGSVRVLWKERTVRYARLDHLVSRVGAPLRRSLGPWEAIAATFPAGTVSGAPKIRAVELLRREERTWRGPYAGAVGLLSPRGEADWALAIRTGFAAGNRLYTAAGAGVVHASQPAREYDETLAKLGQVEATLAGVGA
jgi:anthranilate synthase component I